MCLQAQGIYDNNGGGVGGGGRQARGIIIDNGGVGRRRGIDDASEVLETMTEVRGLDNGPEEYMTMTKSSVEEDEHEYFNNDNGGVGRGYTTRPRYQRQRLMRQRLDDGTMDWK